MYVVYRYLQSLSLCMPDKKTAFNTGSYRRRRRGTKFPGRRITMGTPNHCGECRMTAEGAEKSQ